MGYAGLPVVVALGRRFPGTIGFDRDAEKVARLGRGDDRTGTVAPGELTSSEVRFTSDAADLAQAALYVIAVPTPIDAERRPDLADLESAARIVGRALRPDDVVVLESTVFPGVTEDVLGPALGAASGLEPGVDFRLAYSPERINPGDTAHTLATVPKVIAAQDDETLRIVAAHYGEVAGAGLVEAPSIRVAEAAKVIENVQRDLNIALVNELALIFERMGLDTRDVLETAASKWNFHAYRPGLVGGHCIGVDPYYLTSKAQSIGFDPEVILAGRRTNDRMGAHVATRVTELLSECGVPMRGARIAVLGVTFKPNVGDLRNSQVPGVVRDLGRRGAGVFVHDPLVAADDLLRACGVAPIASDALVDGETFDAVLLAVPHTGLEALALRCARDGTRLLVDLMWAIDREAERALGEGVRLWRL